MKSIDILVPEDNSSGEELNVQADSSMIEKLAATLTEIVEKNNDTNAALAHDFKKALADVLSAKKEDQSDEHVEDEKEENENV